jgi:hypothetical protein
MTNGYIYTLTYECPWCRGPVHCKINSENRGIPESTIDEMAKAIRVQCESLYCPWIGLAGELRVVGRKVNMWML